MRELKLKYETKVIIKLVIELTSICNPAMTPLTSKRRTRELSPFTMYLKPR
jgi:hypothetical protein